LLNTTNSLFPKKGRTTPTDRIPALRKVEETIKSMCDEEGAGDKSAEHRRELHEN